MSIIGGVNVNNVAMPREERAVRRQLDEMISDADTDFDEIVNASLEALAEKKSAHVPDDEDEILDDFQDEGDVDSDQESSNGSDAEESGKESADAGEDDEDGDATDYHSAESSENMSFGDALLAGSEEDE